MRWATPVWFLPHGASGALTLLLGTWSTARALFGFPPCDSLALYVLCASVNAASGAFLAPRGSHTGAWFRRCAALQVCFLYTLSRIPTPLSLTLLDVAVTSILAYLLWVMACQALFQLRGSLRASVLGGVGALGMTFAYPLQFALGGQAWWDECVVTRYPDQAEAMVRFIYVPLTTSFAWMLFAVTLWRRGKLASLAGVFGTSVAAVLLLTVLSQEVHLPEPRSTQKLWVACDPQASVLEPWLDVTPLARRTMSLLLRRPTRDP